MSININACVGTGHAAADYTSGVAQFYLPAGIHQDCEELRNQGRPYNTLDITVLLAIQCTKKLIENIPDWSSVKEKRIGIFFGSSRGATQIFEAEHKNFIETGEVGPHCSPTTTLGNISSWVAQEFLLHDAVAISHSMTCSTGLQALAHANAWLKAGMIDVAICGASECACTPFTVAQMKAIGIYSSETGEYPCQPFRKDARNSSFVLGEGAVACMLTRHDELNLPLIGKILGLGLCVEQITSPTSVDKQGRGFYKAMSNALGEATPDAIFAHAPGTLAGDAAELCAIRALEKELGISGKLAVLSNKFLYGHTFAAFGLLNLASALDFHVDRYEFPYEVSFENPRLENPRRFLVNSAGFGGNIASIFVEKST